MADAQQPASFNVLGSILGDSGIASQTAFGKGLPIGVPGYGRIAIVGGAGIVSIIVAIGVVLLVKGC